MEDFDEKRFGELLIAAKEELATARKAWFI